MRIVYISYLLFLSMIDFKKLIVSLFIVFAVAAIGSFFTADSIATWYASLAKPEFNPPNWLFGPVWTFLYITIAVSLYLVWNKNKLRGTALYAFALQLALNAAWSVIFFGFHLPFIALLCIILLLFSIAWTIVEFYKVNKTASYLLVPYLVWVTFASVLNYWIVILN